MNTRQLQDEYQAALKKAEAARAHAERTTFLRTAAAPGVTFEDVGRAHCEAFLCKTEVELARQDLFKALSKKKA